jgi:hypothetical protein
MIEPRNVTLKQCIDILEARRPLRCEERHHCARPMPACDIDFNTLFLARAELTKALSCLRPLCRGKTKIPYPRQDLVAH